MREEIESYITQIQKLCHLDHLDEIMKLINKGLNNIKEDIDKRDFLRDEILPNYILNKLKDDYVIVVKVPYNYLTIESNKYELDDQIRLNEISTKEYFSLSPFDLERMLFENKKIKSDESVDFGESKIEDLDVSSITESSNISPKFNPNELKKILNEVIDLYSSEPIKFKIEYNKMIKEVKLYNKIKEKVGVEKENIASAYSALNLFKKCFKNKNREESLSIASKYYNIDKNKLSSIIATEIILHKYRI